MILLAAGPKLQHLPDLAVLDERAHDVEHGRILADMGDRQLESPAAERLHHAIALGERAAEGLLHVDVRAGIGHREQHVLVLVDPAGADGDDVGPLLGEHDAIVNSGFSIDASVRITLIDRDVPSYFKSLERLLRLPGRPSRWNGSP